MKLAKLDIFCCHRMCVAVRRNNYPPDSMQVLPAHTITVMAPITLTNLLPYELIYEAGVEGGRITPGCSANLHCANLNEQLEITIQLDGYPGCGVVSITINNCSFTISNFILLPIIVSNTIDNNQIQLHILDNIATKQLFLYCSSQIIGFLEQNALPAGNCGRGKRCSHANQHHRTLLDNKQDRLAIGVQTRGSRNRGCRTIRGA